MKKHFQKKSLLLIISFVLILSCLLVGCNDTINVDNFATALNIMTTKYQDGSVCYYVNIDISTDESEITLNSDDFTYMQDNVKKTAIGFVLQTITSSSSSGETNAYNSYVSKTGKTISLEPNYITKVNIIVDTNSQISSIMYKDSKITKTALY